MTSLQTHSLQRSTKTHWHSLEWDVTTSIIYAWAVAHTLWSCNSQLTSPSVSSIYCNCSLLAWKSNITLLYSGQPHSVTKPTVDWVVYGMQYIGREWTGMRKRMDCNTPVGSTGIEAIRRHTYVFHWVSLGHMLCTVPTQQPVSSSGPSFLLEPSAAAHGHPTHVQVRQKGQKRMCPWERPSYRQLMDHYILHLLTDSSLPTCAAFTCTSSETFFRSNSAIFSSNSPSFLLRC